MPEDVTFEFARLCAWARRMHRSGLGWRKLKMRAFILTIVATFPVLVFRRVLTITPPETLFSESKLAFVGRIEAISPSKITTGLSYPTWEGVKFRWLIAQVIVLESLKGVRKGEIVHTAMLSIDKNKQGEVEYPPMCPGLVEPDVGDVFLLCLVPKPLTNVFAALRAPWDENLSVFAIRRAKAAPHSLRDFRLSLLRMHDERFKLTLSLTETKAEMLSGAVERLRRAYAAELKNPPAEKIVFLEYETYTNRSGWMSDAPKGYATTTNLSRIR